MFDEAEGSRGTGAAAGAVRAAVGHGGPAPDGWPGGVPGGAVARGVWAALCAAESPVTARQVAMAVGTRRESANRALCQLERADWARRERGDAKAGVPDLWSPVPKAHEACFVTHEPRAERGVVQPEAAQLTAPPPTTSVRSARMRTASSTPPASPETSREIALPRLAAGELQEQVRELLVSRPEEEFSPLQLARALGGRSQGAVVNACKRLAANGDALCTCQAPLRFTATHRPE